MKTLPFLLPMLAFGSNARALTISEFSDRTKIVAGSYTRVSPSSSECEQGGLIFHEDPDDRSLTLTIGAATLASGLGANVENVPDGTECTIIQLRSGIADGTAWVDLRETCDGEESHVVTRLVATPRGFRYDERSAAAHTICTYVKKD